MIDELSCPSRRVTDYRCHRRRCCCAHADSLFILRGGFMGGMWSNREAENDAEEDGDWEYYEEDDDINDDDNDGNNDDDDDDDDDAGGRFNNLEQRSDNDEYEYEQEDLEFYGKVQDIDGEFLSDGDSVDSMEPLMDDEQQEEQQEEGQDGYYDYDDDQSSHSDQVDEFLLNTPLNNDAGSEARKAAPPMPRFLLALRKTNAKTESAISLPNPNVSSSKESNLVAGGPDQM
ncbi:hypothetical protein HJC23_012561 [Cyclotella cryptica]|uniref:Uncharacterized protein n=1 Tax=Cyclotella cryptica TaxID=29204 RepID=A0ABD3QQ47_9STRA|eukprot:CCRYP_003250-RA/>CCRYP_003250-RA protein AED:0.39 eAED:0.39 QI:0/-1/0/1/-1/1/1/0/230